MFCGAAVNRPAFKSSGSFNARLWHTKPEIGGHPQSLSALRNRTNSITEKTRGSLPNTEDPTHTHTSKAIYCVCLSCIVEIFALNVAIRWQVQGFVCCMCTCRAGSEAKEHHYGLNTTKTKHRLSGAPQSAPLRLWWNRGRGSCL